jgi:single-stranded DNA-specific DHH superfamily exonuclease
MLTQNQIKEIREHLSKAQNPLFLFDNDQDGLCSFLLLQRYIGRGKGFPVKSSPRMNKDYFRKVKELNADYIFILDQPEVSEEFFEEVEKVNLPVVWIDHHEIDLKKVKIPGFVSYYNPLFNKDKTKEPVTALCYQIVNKKEDSWLGVVGCVSDSFFPDFYKDFKRQYPELAIESKEPFKIFYDSEIGKIARIFGFALKDRVSNVISLIRFLAVVKGPYEILNESKNNKIFHSRFSEIEGKFNRIIDKAKKEASGNLIFFKYAGDTSMSADLANKLMFLFPEKAVIVVYNKGPKVNISARGKNIRKLMLKAIEGLEDATGGGHENAAGAQVRLKDMEEFEKRIRELVK